MTKQFGLNKREVAEVLKSRGISATTQRVEIAHLMLREPQHRAADDILQELNAEYEQVSQATVYNTLRKLVEAGIVRELVFSADRIYYDSNTEPHHHFIDQNTDTIVDVPFDSVQLPCFTVEQDGCSLEVEQMSLIICGRLKSATPRPE